VRSTSVHLSPVPATLRSDAMCRRRAAPVKPQHIKRQREQQIDAVHNRLARHYNLATCVAVIYLTCTA
jgi:hypothetical protein